MHNLSLNCSFALELILIDSTSTLITIRLFSINVEAKFCCKKNGWGFYVQNSLVMVDLKNMDSHGLKMIARFRKAFLLQSTRLGKIKMKIRVLDRFGEFFWKLISLYYAIVVTCVHSDFSQLSLVNINQKSLRETFGQNVHKSSHYNQLRHPFHLWGNLHSSNLKRNFHFVHKHCFANSKSGVTYSR